MIVSHLLNYRCISHYFPFSIVFHWLAILIYLTACRSIFWNPPFSYSRQSHVLRHLIALGRNIPYKLSVRKLRWLLKNQKSILNMQISWIKIFLLSFENKSNRLFCSFIYAVTGQKKNCLRDKIVIMLLFYFFLSNPVENAWNIFVLACFSITNWKFIYGFI